jgi:hypothetical protein
MPNIGTLDRLIYNTRHLHRDMIEAHRQATEVHAYPPAGMGGLALLELGDWLVAQRRRINQIGDCFNDFIELSAQEYTDLTTPAVKFRQ